MWPPTCGGVLENWQHRENAKGTDHIIHQEQKNSVILECMKPFIG